MSNYNFHPKVNHRRIDRDRWNDIFIIGDVHGCKSELDKLIKQIPSNKRDLILFVGDLIRKGPDSHSVVEKVQKTSNMMSVMGNNEWKVINKKSRVCESEREWLSNLPHIITSGSIGVVHGGLNNRKPIKEHTPMDLLTMRFINDGGYKNGKLWYNIYYKDLQIFAGHTVHEDVYISDRCACLDTGCVNGGYLTAIRVKDNKIFQVSSKEYKNRNPDRII